MLQFVARNINTMNRIACGTPAMPISDAINFTTGTIAPSMDNDILVLDTLRYSSYGVPLQG